ncbi:unnamed protein product [Symbiodinium sp. CCMP2456]|nr:unnamed protein product [Symbiodinium sp. CCMP2456]
MACSAACRLRRAIPASTRALQGQIEHPTAWWSKALGGVRGIIRHPVKATGHILGHKLEVVQGSKKRPRLCATYASAFPAAPGGSPLEASAHGVSSQLVVVSPLEGEAATIMLFGLYPSLRAVARSPQPELPIKEQELFCVFKSSSQAQGHCCSTWYKLRVQCAAPAQSDSKQLSLHRPCCQFGVVVSRQQTLTREMLAFWYKPRRKQSHFYRRRQWVTMLRIDEIVLMPEEDPTDPPPAKPVRLLDLWANRWLDPAEKAGIEMVKGEDGALIPKTALIYDGSEHQPGSYHRRGLTSCYRYWPDPAATHWIHRKT